jgi:N-acetylmuramoyl-L-alanine amidase
LPLIVTVGALAVLAVLLVFTLLGPSKAPPPGSTVRAGSAVGVAHAPPTTTTTQSPLPLAGKIVGIDPGHNGESWSDPSVINAPIFNGRSSEACDTTGTETDAGYTEAQFNFNVAQYLATDLRAEGAQVVLTRDSNTGVGPCVTNRADIINAAHADVAVDIHADGGPASGRGFTVLEPVADGPNDAIITGSLSLATDMRNAFAAGTPMPISTYDGTDGLEPRDDLAGLNLATEPKVLIECGNMRNATDAALLITPAFQQQAAHAMATGVADYLAGA